MWLLKAFCQPSLQKAMCVTNKNLQTYSSKRTNLFNNVIFVFLLIWQVIVQLMFKLWFLSTVDVDLLFYWNVPPELLGVILVLHSKKSSIDQLLYNLVENKNSWFFTCTVKQMANVRKVFLTVTSKYLHYEVKPTFSFCTFWMAFCAY